MYTILLLSNVQLWSSVFFKIIVIWSWPFGFLGFYISRFTDSYLLNFFTLFRNKWLWLVGLNFFNKLDLFTNLSVGQFSTVWDRHNYAQIATIGASEVTKSLETALPIYKVNFTLKQKNQDSFYKKDFLYISRINFNLKRHNFSLTCVEWRN